MLEFGEANFNHLYSSYKRRAKTKGLPFYLTKYEFWQLTQQNCFYCDSPPNNINNNKHYNGHYVYNGLDRVENGNGYTIDNVVPCCKDCNTAKGTKTFAEFKEWLIAACRKVQTMTTMHKPDYDALTAEYNGTLLPPFMPEESPAEERYSTPDDVPPLPAHIVDFIESQGKEMPVQAEIIHDGKRLYEYLNGTEETTAYLPLDKYKYWLRDLVNLLNATEEKPNTPKPLLANKPLTQQQINTVFEEIHKLISATREDGQKEYARVQENGFGNFQRIQGFMPELTQGQILMVYAMKHLDGILSYLNGHTSQRESVKGRIIDEIVYLQLLYAMVLADEGWTEGESITKGWKE